MTDRDVFIIDAVAMVPAKRRRPDSMLTGRQRSWHRTVTTFIAGVPFHVSDGPVHHRFDSPFVADRAITSGKLFMQNFLTGRRQ